MTRTRRDSGLASLGRLWTTRKQKHAHDEEADTALRNPKALLPSVACGRLGFADHDPVANSDYEPVTESDYEQVTDSIMNQ